MPNLPTDIILHILSFLPLSDICHLLTSTSSSNARLSQCHNILNFYIKQVLLARVKREAWSIVLYTPATYFAILCNRDMLALSNPIAKLTCVGYNSSSEYLLFQTKNHPFDFELSEQGEELEFQSMRIYCSQWPNLFREDDKSGHIRLCWRQGEQTKQLDENLWIKYQCTKKAMVSAEQEENSRCNKQASSATVQKRLLQIHSMRVSLEWLKQGLIV